MHLISLTRLCSIAFLSMYIVLIDVLIYSAAQLQECLINLLTYLHIQLPEIWAHSYTPFPKFQLRPWACLGELLLSTTRCARLIWYDRFRRRRDAPSLWAIIRQDCWQTL